MSITPDVSSLTRGLLDDDLIDLEPSLELELASPADHRAGGGVAQATAGSLARETHSLRRTRLGSAALFLTVVFAILFLWSLFGTQPDHWFVSLMMFVRFAIAAACAWLCMSGVSLTSQQVRWTEYVFFGSFTIILVTTQYIVNLDLLQHDNIVGFITHLKNGVMGMFGLMVLYGMFIPNDPRSAARVVLTMALATIAGMVALLEREDLAPIVEQLHTATHAGSNVLFLMIGAALAIYGTFVLNGLRSELHEARKFGQYQIGEKLGSGGMGEVYLAEHQLLKRPCALKLIRPESGTDPIALARFEREVQAAARLSHPNTIEIFDYGHTDDGTFYYVMEYLKGVSLQDLVKRFGPLPFGRVIYLFRQVCAGLAEAHTLGLVHRDLKPANVFIAVRGGESDVAKVLDFGLVKLTADNESVELTSDQRVSGTPLYMSPEQAVGDRALDARADIYALGCMLYFVLTSQPPFQGSTALEVMMAHARDTVVPPSKLRPGLPAELDQIVLTCLAKKPDERYPDVKALGKALAACPSAADWDAEKAQEWWANADRLTSQPA
jgi:tRNA A-37 threonylcarbamoyl transferase component Bud32